MMDQFYYYIADPDDRYYVILIFFDVRLAPIAAYIRYFVILPIILFLFLCPLFFYRQG